MSSEFLNSNGMNNFKQNKRESKNVDDKKKRSMEFPPI